MTRLIRLNGVQTKPTVAFLGPLGTYSHQASYEQFHDTVEFIEKGKIADVFDALGETDFGVIPQENTIFGPVVETYDALRGVESGFIRGEIALKVQHCLIVRKGVKISDIDCVMSHEQALGQCRGFLAKYLPGAATMKMTSTAAAAEVVANTSGSTRAAICSKICLKMFQGLELLEEGIQDEKSNYTRFYVMAKNRKTTLPVVPVTPVSHALVRIHFGCPENNPGDITAAVKALELGVARIDRRPALNRTPFDDVYFVELRDSQARYANTNGVDAGGDIGRMNGKTPWHERVEEAIERVRVLGGEVKLLGLW
ncbi:prephenate dehydratase [Marasmius crinis-equi]|uniref:prephenate dehydratase n=1 Tax=Marasmius crinis-equi TaxID=585013 RepID=A0ABR3FPL1_9AGAR